MFDFLKRKTKAEKPIKVKAQAARYKLVSYPDQSNREWTAPEREPEDVILDPYARGKMINSARQATRNSGIMASLLKTMTLNVVGSEGGKIVLPFDNQDVLRQFSKWTRSCDFVDNSITFNEILKLVLLTRLLNGDMCVLHDNDLITGSNRLLLFEGDEIVTTTEDAIKYHYGVGAKQSQGKVYDVFGRFCGITVSRAERGNDVANPDKCFFLHCDPDASPMDNDWFYVANRWRPNQGRGVTPFSTALAGIEDAEMLKNFELQSAKRNAQLLLQVLQEPQKEEEIAIPSTFGTDTDIDSMTEEQLKALVEKEIQPRVVTLDRLNAANAQVQVMESGVRAEMIDTKRPNPNVQQFLDFLTLRSYTPFGLSESFAMGKPDGNYKANQLFSERAFEEQQKTLEQFCDWCFRRWHDFSVKHGKIKPLTDEQIESVTWEWPHLLEIDPAAKANAQKLQLENMLTTYKDILGNNWQKKLEQSVFEHKWMSEHGICPPSEKLVSGGQTTQSERLVTESTTGEEKTT